MSEIVLQGISASPGIAFGNAFILDKQEFVVAPRSILANEVPSELARFEEAILCTKQEIKNIQTKLSSSDAIHDAKIFDAHLMILEDPKLLKDVNQRIESENYSCEYIFSEVIKMYVDKFLKIEDEYLRERAGDVKDIARRVLTHLIHENRMDELDDITEELILIGHDLSPSDTASMYSKNIIAFATDIGGKTSHTAIMAKSLGVPAVVGVKDATLRIHNQDFLIIDGTKGVVIVNPTEETLVQYHSQQDKIEETKGRFEDIKDLPSQTTDGKRIGLFANVELKEEIPSVLKYGADGIGLYRTEFFYMNRVDLPTEQEQFETYKEVAENIKPSCVTIRTLDLGGDKFLSSLQIPRDMSAHIGWRAIQFCLHQPKIFKTQLSAILRASAYGNIRLMYPMITGVNELHQANAILNEVKDTLRSDDVKFDEKMPIGCMIEVPAAAVTANILAKEADFFSIGTNDLIQYTLAIDRVNEQTAELYEPSHPAILQLIKMTVDAAHKEGIKVSLCGEMASELIFAFILVGLEVDDLSMSPVSILQVKEMIRNVGYKEAKKIAKEVLSLSTAEEVEHVLKTRLNKLAPQIFNMES